MLRESRMRWSTRRSRLPGLVANNRTAAGTSLRSRAASTWELKVRWAVLPKMIVRWVWTSAACGSSNGWTGRRARRHSFLWRITMSRLVLSVNRARARRITASLRPGDAAHVQAKFGTTEQVRRPGLVLCNRRPVRCGARRLRCEPGPVRYRVVHAGGESRRGLRQSYLRW